MSSQHIPFYATCLVILAMAFSGPKSFLGQVWRQGVIAPLSRLPSRFTRGHVVLGVGVIGLATVLIWALHADGARLVSMAMPDVLLWASTFEVTIWLDALLAAMTVAAGLRLRAMGGSGRMKLRRLMRRGAWRGGTGNRRQRRTRRDIPPNDNEDGPARWLAA